MKNIAIVGAKPDTWQECKNLDRRSWEIWRYSRSNYEKEPTATTWFELHHKRNYNRFENSKPGYIEFLGLPKPDLPERFVDKSKYTEVKAKKPNKVILYDDFPFGELIDEFGPWFFSHGQAPWLMAYAITKNPEKIKLFGIEPQKTRYGFQRLEVQHFISIAQQRGIEVEAPEDPGLMEYSPLYCIEQDWGGQKTYLETLRQRGVRVGSPEMAHTSLQSEFASELPKNRELEKLKEMKEARKIKYGVKV